MSTETRTETATTAKTRLEPWQAGLVGGLVGGLVFGAMMSMMMPDVIEMGIPALYGIEGPAGLTGWIIHMSNSAVLGVVFGAIVGASDLSGTGTLAGVGLAYGIVLWVALAAVVMPVWLSAVGFPMAPPLPNFDPMSMVGHAVYGVVLGAVYAVVR
ncbi:histidine kinase [Halalkalicoccus sp. NIPERK01]|uniref:histidine kinase n=1 Tax=Halalkalicoccus sp. NIPERK01 TaxID=3053469 RepID=UPI00256ED815|nr:histidine kinase [Halalkalicoccus sp. NIPERK01]MDL5362869.1 histidine kinase [Halalkalicoccus sp. NIPERK01]